MKKIFWTGIVILGIVGTITYLIIRSFYLKDPVMIENHILTSINSINETKGSAEFHIFYVANREDCRSIRSITFPELGGKNSGNVIFSENKAGRRDFYTIGNYQINEEWVFVSNIPKDASNYIITKASITWNDGNIEEVNLGEIVLYWSEEQDMLETTYVSSDNSGLVMTDFTIKEDLVVHQIDDELLRKLGLSSIKINNEEYPLDNLAHLNLRLKKGETLCIEVPVNETTQKHSYIFGGLKLVYATDSGKNGELYLNQIQYKPQFDSQWQLRDYLKDRGV